MSDQQLPPDLQDLLSLLRPVVNLLVPIAVVVGPDEEEKMLGRTHWLLPQVPAIGEHVQVAGRHIPVTKVLWTDERKVLVILEQQRVEDLSALKPFELDGWGIIIPAEGDDPPANWLT